MAVAPVVDGQPVTTSVVYDPSLLLLTLLLATAAGMLMVVGCATSAGRPAHVGMTTTDLDLRGMSCARRALPASRRH